MCAVRDAVRTKPPNRSTILLYLASLPPDQPVAWGHRIAAALRDRKLAKLSPNTVYQVLEDFRTEKLVELVNPPQPQPESPMEAMVDTASTDEERRKLKVTNRLRRAGYTEGELREVDERYRQLHEREELAKRLHERRRKRLFHGLAGLWPREVDWLVKEKRRTGFKPPDPRAKGYRLTPDGRKVAELLKQKGLLTEWWTCDDSPTDNPIFLSKLRGAGFEPFHIALARKARVLEKVEGEPAVRRERYDYTLVPPGAFAQALRPHLVVVQRRCRYLLT